MSNFKLVRSRSNKLLSGVFGGLAPLIKIDATILRLIYTCITVFSGAFPGLILYIIAAIIIPYEDEGILNADEMKSKD